MTTVAVSPPPLHNLIDLGACDLLGEKREKKKIAKQRKRRIGKWKKERRKELVAKQYAKDVCACVQLLLENLVSKT